MADLAATAEVRFDDAADALAGAAGEAAAAAPLPRFSGRINRAVEEDFAFSSGEALPVGAAAATADDDAALPLAALLLLAATGALIDLLDAVPPDDAAPVLSRS